MSLREVDYSKCFFCQTNDTADLNSAANWRPNAQHDFNPYATLSEFYKVESLGSILSHI